MKADVISCWCRVECVDNNRAVVSLNSYMLLSVKVNCSNLWCSFIVYKYWVHIRICLFWQFNQCWNTSWKSITILFSAAPIGKNINFTMFLGFTRSSNKLELKQQSQSELMFSVIGLYMYCFNVWSVRVRSAPACSSLSRSLSCLFSPRRPAWWRCGSVASCLRRPSFPSHFAAVGRSLTAVVDL